MQKNTKCTPITVLDFDRPNDGYTVTYVDVDEESLLKTMDVIHEHNKKYPDGYFNV